MYTLCSSDSNAAQQQQQWWRAAVPVLAVFCATVTPGGLRQAGWRPTAAAKGAVAVVLKLCCSSELATQVNYLPYANLSLRRFVKCLRTYIILYC
jgi:hypothetical protein